jgi:D-aminoacyl-tRNA deacylase
MRVLIQRVAEASVAIDGIAHASIQKGMLLLLGIAANDTAADLDYIINKTLGLRIFNDENGVPNLNISQVTGEILLVSQFTLLANTKKGNRPSYIEAARPEIAIPMYEKCIFSFNQQLHQPIKTGVFGADMQISLINDGPFSIWIDSKEK